MDQITKDCRAKSLKPIGQAKFKCPQRLTLIAQIMICIKSSSRDFCIDSKMSIQGIMHPYLHPKASIRAIGLNFLDTIGH
jgi:hypothetical protein